MNWNLNYKVMNELSDGEVCAPTAATNFMYYWYKRNDKYKKLLSSSWKNTFNFLFYYMGTTTKGGTKRENIKTGYSKYLSQKGFEYSITYHNGTDSGRDLMKDIDKNRPCHLLLLNHSKYKNHSVLAVGYQQFIYKHWYGNSYETYIRIADGWTSKAGRFVWGGCKGLWHYLSIDIKTK